MTKKVRSDRTEARREGARARFSIMSYNAWSAKTLMMRDADGEAQYQGYVGRKQVEATALGL